MKQAPAEITNDQNANDDPSPASVITTSTAMSTVSTITHSAELSTPKRASKPTPTRVILEVKGLSSLISRHLKDCPKCGSSLKMTLPNCCVATAIKLECTNEFCSFIDIERPASADVPLLPGAGSPLKERNTDYAINVLYVLSFMSSGDGGTEAERLLGLLGLPNSTTMNKRSFGIIQQRLAPVVESLTQKVLLLNLEKEVEMYYNNELDEDGVLLFAKWKSGDLQNNPDKYPRLITSTDMAWQQRACGKQCNSCSGHCLFVGQRTRKPIAKQIYSKSCSYCKAFYRKHQITEQVPPHECIKNYDGSSGSIEPVAVLQMYIALYDERSVVVERIITDDDSTIKAKLKWSNQTWMTKNNSNVQPRMINSKGNEVARPDHGEIPGHMPEPSFDADPNHRKKLVGKQLWALAAKNVKEKKTMTKCDAMRLQRYYSFMARQLKYKKTDAEMLSAAQAVLEHHFDCHDYCGDWCLRKQQTNDQRKEQKKFYRSKTDDKDLYDYLKGVLERFITIEALKEIAHGYDTLVNESLNNTISWVAPKNKVYASTVSLACRIGIVLCINTLGTMEYYRQIFELLEMVMTDDVRYYIQQVSIARDKRNVRGRKKDTKIKRSEKFHNKLKEHTKVAKKERKKRRGQYKTGIGMDGGYDSDADSDTPTTQAPKKKRAKRAPVICPLCKKKGHKTNKSKKCEYYGKDPPRIDGEEQDGQTLQQLEAAADAKEVEQLDCIGFDDDSDVLEFFSADEYSTDNNAASSDDEHTGTT